MRKIAASLALAGVLVFPGCTLLQADKFEDFVAGVREATVADVRRALTLAQEQQDTIAVTCWSTLLGHLEKGSFRRADDELLATAIQRLRAESRGQGPLTQVREACQPVFESLKDVAGKAAARVAGKAPIPGL